MRGIIQGQRVLVVEDEVLIALELSDSLVGAGAEVIGPAATVRTALRMIEHDFPTAAILDVSLDTEDSVLIAQRLTEIGIPFIFHTGNFAGRSAPSDWPHVPVVRKPAPMEIVLDTLADAIHDS